MSIESDATVLLKHGKVKRDVESRNYIYFTVKEYDVVFDKRKNYWMCLCEYGSVWRGNKEEVCKHVKACQLLLDG